MKIPANTTSSTIAISTNSMRVRATAQSWSASLSSLICASPARLRAHLDGNGDTPVGRILTRLCASAPGDRTLLPEGSNSELGEQTLLRLPCSSVIAAHGLDDVAEQSRRPSRSEVDIRQNPSLTVGVPVDRDRCDRGYGSRVVAIEIAQGGIQAAGNGLGPSGIDRAVTASLESEQILADGHRAEIGADCGISGDRSRKAGGQASEKRLNIRT